MNSLEKPGAWSKLGGKIKKIFRWIIVLAVIFVCFFIYFKFFFTYSEGYRAGLLQKFSKKGVIFKTYEGEMILSSVSSNRDVTLASEKFLFTVVNKNLVREFDTLQGEKITVHYKQKKGAIFFRGDSPYLVDSIMYRR
ncbi:MAG: hypothetical protein ABSG89_07535 [Bacteroidales bacterium]|jgi:hypothetical protein